LAEKKGSTSISKASDKEANHTSGSTPLGMQQIAGLVTTNGEGERS